MDRISVSMSLTQILVMSSLHYRFAKVYTVSKQILWHYLIHLTLFDTIVSMYPQTDMCDMTDNIIYIQ